MWNELCNLCTILDHAMQQLKQKQEKVFGYTCIFIQQSSPDMDIGLTNRTTLFKEEESLKVYVI